MIKNQMLSPGNIFWKKRSGDLVLITMKGDVINHDLIHKLEAAQHEIIIENVSDPYQDFQLSAIYEKYCEELLMRNKIKWREQFIELLRVDYVVNQHSQFELNQIGWKLFSKFSNEEVKSFIQKDIGLFKRHLSIASNSTFIAFVLGYSEPTFLNKLFASTLKNLMELGDSINVLGLKEKIEYLRLQDSFDEDSIESMKEIASDEVLSSTVLFERFDGSGPRKINSREMTDLEMVLVALNRSYGVETEKNENAFLEISRGNFDCGSRLLGMLQKLLEKKEVAIEEAA